MIAVRRVNRLTVVLRIILVSTAMSGEKDEVRQMTKPSYRVYVRILITEFQRG